MNLYLFDDVNSETSREVVENILEHPYEEIIMFINCHGGHTYAYMSIVIAMDLHGAVDTVCLGMAGSSAAGIFAAGRSRYIVPSGHVCLHEVHSGMDDNEISSSFIEVGARLSALNSWIAASVAKYTGREENIVMVDMQTNRWFTAKQAIAYGLADAIYTKREWRRHCKQQKETEHQRQ